MRRQDGRLIEAVDRVNDFLEENHEVIDGALTPEARALFSVNRERMVEFMKAQEAHARGTQQSIAVKHELRARLLREHMTPISALARVVLPGVREVGALTVLTRNRPFVSLVAAGYGMAEAAKVHEAALRGAGLPADFIARLIAATDALRDATSGTAQTSGRRVEASSGLKKQGRIVRKVLRALDALVRAAIATDDVLLARWAHIRRVSSRATSSGGVGQIAGGTDVTGVPSSGSDAAPDDASTDSARLDRAA